MAMKLVLWTARGLDLALILLVAALAIGEGVPPIWRASGSELFAHATFLLMLAGLVTAWKREGLGSALLLAGFVLFWANNYAASGQWRLGWVFLLFAVTGLLFALHWRQTSKSDCA